MASYGYEYETSPRKLKPDYDIPTKKQSNNKKPKNIKNTRKKKKSAKKLKYNIKPIIYIAIAFGMLFIVSYRNSLINESYSNKESLKAQVGQIEKENEQLRVNIESKLNLNSVQKTAEDELGMQKLNNSQKVYVNLQKKDYVEPTTEEVIIDSETSWWDKILNSLTEIIK